MMRRDIVLLSFVVVFEVIVIAFLLANSGNTGPQIQIIEVPRHIEKAVRTNCPLASVPSRPVDCGIKGVAAAYVLNLWKRVDRRERMRAIFSTLGVHLQFVRATEAIEMARLAPEMFPELVLDHSSSAISSEDTASNESSALGEEEEEEGMFLDGRRVPEFDWASSPELDKRHGKVNVTKSIELLGNVTHEKRVRRLSTIACWQSFVRVLSHICARNETALVFEDDVDATVDFPEKIADIVARLPQWSIVKLGTCGWDPRPYYPAPGFDDVYPLRGFTCLHGLLFRPHAACVVKSRIDITSMREAVDLRFNKAVFSEVPSLKYNFIVHPAIVTQIPEAGSDIPASLSKPRAAMLSSAQERLEMLLSFKKTRTL